MESKRVGFVGCYSHDLILLLAGALNDFGKSVLLVDRNVNHTLAASFPVPEGLSVTREVVEYDRFLYTAGKVEEKNRTETDVMLLDFGMATHWEIAGCDSLFLISDVLPHHIHRLMELHIHPEKVCHVILREVFSKEILREKELAEFLSLYAAEAPMLLYPDERDLRARMVCETHSDFRLGKASEQVRETVYQMFHFLFPQVSQKEFWKTVKYKERRWYS